MKSIFKPAKVVAFPVDLDVFLLLRFRDIDPAMAPLVSFSALEQLEKPASESSTWTLLLHMTRSHV